MAPTVVTTSRQRKKSNSKILLAAVAILTIVAALLILKKPKTTAVEEVTTTTRPKATTVGVDVPKDASVKDGADEVRVATSVDAPDETTVVVTEAIKEEKPKRQAGIKVLNKDGNEVFKPHPELKTRTDKFLFSILRRPLGAGKTVLSVYKLEEDFKKSLEAPVEVLETDTDEEKAVKMELEGFKQELAERMKEGESVVALLEDLQAQVNYAAEEHALARRSLYALIKEGDFDAAEIFLEKTNKRFEEEGILKLHVPEKLKIKAIKEHGEEYLAKKKTIDDAEARLKGTEQ